MNRYRFQIVVALAAAVVVSSFGCVNLDPPWVGRLGAGGAGAGGEDGFDAGGGGGSTGSGGSIAEGGSMTSTGGALGSLDASTADVGVGAGGVGGSVAGDVGGSALDGAAASGGKSGTGGSGVSTTGGSTSTSDAETPADTANDTVRDVAPDKSSTPDAAPDTAKITDTAPGPETDPFRGPIVHYTCDQTTGAMLTDSSGYGHDADLIGTYAFADGKVGRALTLTPANGVDGDSAPGFAALPVGLLATAAEMTVATWVYLNTNPLWARIFDFGKDTTSYMFLSGNGGDRLVFAISTGGNGKEQKIIVNAALPTGGWKHVAMVIGSTGGHLYLDGAEVGANTGMTLMPSSLGSTPNNWIGKSQFADLDGDPYLDGVIDDFYIYDRALSAAEILKLSGN